MEYIKGVDRQQMTLLPECLDDYIEAENPVRVIEAYVESLDLNELGFTRVEPNETGRPMYSSRDLLKLYLYGYSIRIRSTRRLEAEARRNIELMWLMRRLCPDHHTIARFRKENAKALKRLFQNFTLLCTELGLMGRELVAIDGSKFRAVNSKDANFNEEKLNERIRRIEEHIEEYMRVLEETEEEEGAPRKSAEEISKIIEELERRKTLYQGYQDKMEETGESQISTTDPEARRMIDKGGSIVGYNVQIAVDAKHKIIAHYEVIQARNDLTSLSNMAISTAKSLGVEELTALADKGYASATTIAECIMNGITAHVAGTDYDICIPVKEGVEGEASPIASHREGRCVYIRERNIALCPMGKVLYPHNYKKKKRSAVYKNPQACAMCLCKCTTESSKRFEIEMRQSEFTREYDIEGLEVMQVRVRGEKQLIRQRKEIVEHPYGTVKRAMGADYVLTKGLKSVAGEFALVFLAYSIKRAINILGVKGMIEGIAAYALKKIHRLSTDLGVYWGKEYKSTRLSVSPGFI